MPADRSTKSATKENSLTDTYERSSVEERAKIVQNFYENRDGRDIYATSRDFNLRELEIDFIIDCIQSITSRDMRPRILDIGCGNGYTDFRIAKAVQGEIVGVDFSKQMISGAEYLRSKHQNELLSRLVFQAADVRNLKWNDGYFDIVTSERCLLNLPAVETQHDVIRGVHRVLKKGGVFIMVEGTRDGLRRLNDLRIKVGLEPITDQAEDNVSSLKFEEKNIEEFLSKYFKVIVKQHFGMYYLISRVVHPLLVFPDPPKYNARINEIAREIAMHEPDFKQMGHVMGLMLEAI